MSGVKLFAAIPRKPGISAEEFHDHWRHPHGTMGRRISTIRKYVQSHHIHCSLLSDSQTRYEGIAEVWMDNVADAVALPDEPIYVRDLVPDEREFIDLGALRFLITQEDVLVSGPDIRESLPTGDCWWRDADRANNIKIIQLIEHAGTDVWRPEQEVMLGKRLGSLRHVVCLPHASAYQGSAPPFAGVREMWWPTVTAFQDGVKRAKDAWDALVGAPPHAVTLLAHSERFR
jgi:hypothetical protein